MFLQKVYRVVRKFFFMLFVFVVVVFPFIVWSQIIQGVLFQMSIEKYLSGEGYM